MQQASLETFRKVLRVLWIASGLFFIWYDITALGNNTIQPTVWLLIGVLALVGGAIGFVGGLGGVFIVQGILKYRANLVLGAGKIAFAAGFTTFDKIAHATFILYGIFLIYRQIHKNRINKNTQLKEA